MQTLMLPANVAPATATLIIIVLFLLLLIQKEIAGSLPSERAQRLNHMLNITLLPLALLVVHAIAMRIAEVMR